VGIYLVTIVLVVALVNMFLSAEQNPREEEVITYSELLNDAGSGKIARVIIDEGILRGIYTNGGMFRAYAVVDKGDLAARLSDKGVNVEILPAKTRQP
jgi:ATP-dependent Zn protease